MESEFITLDKAGEEAEWLRNFLEDILFWPKHVGHICIYCDSQAAIGRAEELCTMERLVIYDGDIIP